MKTITLLINTMLMGTTSAWAFTLNDAWQAAREHSSELKQAQYQFQAYEQQKPIARAALLPQYRSAHRTSAKTNLSHAKSPKTVPVGKYPPAKPFLT